MNIDNAVTELPQDSAMLMREVHSATEVPYLHVAFTEQQAIAVERLQERGFATLRRHGDLLFAIYDVTLTESGRKHAQTYTM